MDEARGFTFHLPLRGAPRRVRVVLPPRPEPAAPLLVMWDGQNALDDGGSYAGGWFAHEAVARLPRTIRQPVIVAIDHGGADRIRELWHDLDDTLAFVTEAVLPEVRGHLDVTREARWTAIAGSSMGGLASLGAILRRPDVFGTALCFSPSVWIARHAALEELARAGVAGRIYGDVGLREGRALVHWAGLLRRRLGDLRLDDRQLKWREDARGRHRERDWRRRLPGALRWGFRR